MTSFNWTCPHCGKAQTVVDERQSLATIHIGLSNLPEGSLVIEKLAIGCANPDCRKLTLSIRIGQDDNRIAQGWNIDPRKDLVLSQTLLPAGPAKPQPSFIPLSIREDYAEACLICDLSPKAAATLARRCLQGMIRDFCGISKSRLIDEIVALQDAVAAGTVDRAVTEESVRAIDHVRGIGNIGAHMEKEIDVIVSVDAGEARTLIELIEMLFEEWYVDRERRRDRLARIETIATEKAAQKEAGRRAKSARGMLTAPDLANEGAAPEGTIASSV